MNLSYKWLKRYLDIEISIESLSEILTMIGLEVEGIEKVETIKGGLKGIVVGYVEQCDKHPNADKLSVTKVNIGEIEHKQIVCGAPNVAAGQKVLVATVGATLHPADADPWKIKKGKIRGEVSEGMICAEDELGLGTDHSGIIVLPDDVPIGSLAADYYNISDDYVFDIGLTPNRSDATSHLGAAKDLAAYLKIHKNRKESVKEPIVTDFKVDVDKPAIKVVVENEAQCPRYTGISLADVKVGPSPQWMRDLLVSIGVRPINNIVDITNFVLHELGQPLHAFDQDKIQNGEVRVKNLPQGSKFLSLDEQERTLRSDDLMICDGNDNPMCIAGVFGGLNSGVSENTTNIFLESAHFAASAVRQTSTHHLLRTDAAKIFEKGSDPNITVYALERAALLMKEYAGATIVSEITDHYPKEITPVEIPIGYAKINRVIGTELEKQEVHDILRAMEMELKPVDEDTLIVKVPTNKADVTRDVDIIEEILRIYGFNTVPIPAQLKTTINHEDHPNERQIRKAIANMLASHGWSEMMGMSLIESAHFDQDRDDLIYINNTSNIHLDIMRPNAVVSGLRSIAHNLNYQQTDLKLFEFGRTYRIENGEHKEKAFLSCFLTGNDTLKGWATPGSSADFYVIKGWVDRILERLGVQGFQTKVFEPMESDDHIYSEGMQYHRGDQVMVRFGKLSRKLLKKMDIGVPVYYAEFNYKSLLKSARKSKTKTSVISKYPSSERDLSLVLERKVTFEDILRVTAKTDKKLIQETTLFDVYENAEQLGEGKKAYAVKFLFQDVSKTLSDKEIDKVMNSLIKNFETKLGASIRS